MGLIVALPSNKAYADPVPKQRAAAARDDPPTYRCFLLVTPAEYSLLILLITSHRRLQGRGRPSLKCAPRSRLRQLQDDIMSHETPVRLRAR